jgi:hypothetical protein
MTDFNIQNGHELTDAELDLVAGGGGNTWQHAVTSTVKGAATGAAIGAAAGGGAGAAVGAAVGAVVGLVESFFE